MAVKEIPSTTTETTARIYTLNSTHRCDRCGAQAYLRVFLKSGNDLLFCGNHYKRYEAKLEPIMRGKIDERDRLVENKLQGSEK